MTVILIVRVPNRHSRPKTISIPSVRRKLVPGAAGQLLSWRCHARRAQRTELFAGLPLIGAKGLLQSI